MNRFIAWVESVPARRWYSIAIPVGIVIGLALGILVSLFF